MKQILFFMIYSYLFIINQIPLEINNRSFISNSEDNFYEERTTFNKKHSIEIIEFKRYLNKSN